MLLLPLIACIFAKRRGVYRRKLQLESAKISDEDIIRMSTLGQAYTHLVPNKICPTHCVVTVNAFFSYIVKNIYKKNIGADANTYMDDVKIRGVLCGETSDEIYIFYLNQSIKISQKHVGKVISGHALLIWKYCDDAYYVIHSFMDKYRYILRHIGHSEILHFYEMFKQMGKYKIDKGVIESWNNVCGCDMSAFEGYCSKRDAEILMVHYKI